MIKTLAKVYESSSWTRFIIVIPWVGPAIHEYLMAKAKEASVPFFKNIWRFQDNLVYIICPQLDKSGIRQEPEPGEFLYLGKYGDIDSLLEVLTSLSKLFPRLSAKFCTSEEFVNIPGNPYANNLILIGGPDYNKVVNDFMQYTPFEFVEKNGVVVLRNKEKGELFKSRESRNEVTDYGFFLKISNPNNTSKKLIMINGIHTYGVYGAVKCFLAQDEHEINISLDNCKEVIDELGKERDFAVVLEVKSINKKIGVPRIKKGDLIAL